MIDKKVIDLLRVEPGKRARLEDRPTDPRGFKFLRGLEDDELKERALVVLEKSRAELSREQELLYAGDVHAILVILQAMDAAGKDGTIRHVMSGVNPQGCHVTSFKRPSDEELDHDYLWRCVKALPERGRIGIFNRSYYEEVLVVKVHPEHLERQKLPPGKRGKSFWKARYEDISTFERYLARNGTVIVKFFLHISKEEQKRRLLDRLKDPEKHWKSSLADIGERAYWNDYMEAYEAALTETSKEWAPWYVIPADKKWAARCLVADILASTLRSLDLEHPKLPPKELDGLSKAIRQLEAE